MCTSITIRLEDKIKEEDIGLFLNNFQLRIMDINEFVLEKEQDSYQYYGVTDGKATCGCSIFHKKRFIPGINALVDQFGARMLFFAYIEDGRHDAAYMKYYLEGSPQIEIDREEFKKIFSARKIELDVVYCLV